MWLDHCQGYNNDDNNNKESTPARHNANTLQKITIPNTAKLLVTGIIETRFGSSRPRPKLKVSESQ